MKDVAADCLEQIKFNEDTRTVFETDRVKKRLRVVMDLVIRALELISQNNESSRFSRGTFPTLRENANTLT